ncbi:MAG TPA: conjugal transfer protein [Solirubrobacterales bacterium]|nr:conjugal transfer protein [Solirubrobacterales bacterium]
MSRPIGTVLRPLGRAALWVVVVILLVRGAAALLAAPESESTLSPDRAAGPGRAAEALAVGFARTYLESPTPAALGPFLAEGAHVAAGRGPSAPGAEVGQAGVLRASDLGGGRWVLTVFCDLRDARSLDLAVPIVRRGAGEVAVLGAPSIVAAPAPAGADPERPRPLAGPEAGAIGELVAKFIPAYVSARDGRALSYLLAPGARVVPLGGALDVVSVGRAEQLGDGEGPRRELLVGTRLKEPSGGTVYPASYRLQVVRRSGRWYVATVEGAVS